MPCDFTAFNLIEMSVMRAVPTFLKVSTLCYTFSPLAAFPFPIFCISKLNVSTRLISFTTGIMSMIGLAFNQGTELLPI